MGEISNIGQKIEFFENKISQQQPSTSLQSTTEKKIETANPQEVISQGGARPADLGETCKVNNLVKLLEPSASGGDQTSSEVNQVAIETINVQPTSTGLDEEQTTALQQQNIESQNRVESQLISEAPQRASTSAENFADRYEELMEVGNTDRQLFEFVHLANDMANVAARGNDDGKPKDWDLPTIQTTRPRDSFEIQVCLKHLIDGTSNDIFLTAFPAEIDYDFCELSDLVASGQAVIDDEMLQIIDLYIEASSNDYFNWESAEQAFEGAISKVPDGPFKDAVIDRLELKGEAIQLLQSLTADSSAEDVQDYLDSVIECKGDDDHAVLAQVQRDLKLSGVGPEGKQVVRASLRQVFPRPAPWETTRSFPWD